MKKGTLIVYTMNVNEKKKPISIYGGAVFTVLAISVVCAWALFYLTNFKPVALFKTTRYTLTHEIGMSFYDFPGGKEQEVLYWDEAGGEDVSERPEPKPGERWMYEEKIQVEEPEDGWARVDIGDGGVALYVNQEYVQGEETNFFEGRKAGKSLLGTGVRNLPPKWCMWLMGILIYVLLYYPWWLILKKELSPEVFNRKLLCLVYVGMGYFFLLVVLKYVCGYNLTLYWFVMDGYLGSTLLALVNMILGILGAFGLFTALFGFFRTQADMFGSILPTLRRIGWKGILLISFGLYFILIFTGVLITIVAFCVGVYFFLKLLPGAMATAGGIVRRGDEPSHDCCRTCRWSNGNICQRHNGHISDPDSNCCTDYMR